MAWMKMQTHYIISKMDKGLGPCALEYLRYAKDILSHLTNLALYLLLTGEELYSLVNKVIISISNCL